MTNLIDDIFTVNAAPPVNEVNPFAEELSFMESETGAKFFAADFAIKAEENGKVYGIEQVASGLKTFAPLYLALKYELVKDCLIVDEPEVSLHPKWIEVMAEVLYRLSKKGMKVFVATHSDIFIEKINFFLKRDKDFSADVWKFERTEKGNVGYNADMSGREISPKEYLEVFHNIVKAH